MLAWLPSSACQHGMHYAPQPCRLLAQKKDNWPVVRDIYFENNDTTAQPWDEVITVEKTGMYYLWFVICDPDLAAATVEGATIWKNPTGVAPVCHERQRFQAGAGRLCCLFKRTCMSHTCDLRPGPGSCHGGWRPHLEEPHRCFLQHPQALCLGAAGLGSARRLSAACAQQAGASACNSREAAELSLAAEMRRHHAQAPATKASGMQGTCRA